MIDARGHILDLNRAAERTFGWPRDEAVGQELGALLVPPDLRAVHRESLARYVATGEAHILDQTLQLRALRRGGAEFPVELKITSIQTDEGPMFVGYLRDVSDLAGALAEIAELKAGPG
jgi:PAS domain S-box-containing protein